MRLLDRFPSFRQLQTNAIGAVGRFPFTLLSGLIGTVVAVYLAEDPSDTTSYMLQRILQSAALGLPLFTALAFLAEKRQWGRPVALVSQAVGLILLVAYYLSLPEQVLDSGSTMLRFLLIILGLHFSVACLPYIGGRQTHGFWQFNMSLFSRFLIAAVYSGVLYVGLAVALAAADHLFGFEVRPERYVQLWAIMTGLFYTCVFLAGVPKDLEALDTATDYPKGLAVFAQYILLPLVGLYFVILIAYEAKIIVEWNWPIGWVSELVLWFSVVGLLSLMMLYPLRNQTEKRWVQTFMKWFFRAMIPLVALLFLAILRRISDYGITEPRYLVLGMAIGLVLVTLYFLISKSKDIRIIPILLAATSFLSAYGPWSVSSVSLSSQMGRFESFMIANEMLEGDTLRQIESRPTSEDQKEMSSIIRYVCDWHGPNPFAKWLAEDVVDSMTDLPRREMAEQLAEAFDLDYVGRYSWAESGERFTLSGPDRNFNVTSFVVTGFDYLVDFTLEDGNDFEGAFPLDLDSCFVSLDTSGPLLTVWVGQDYSHDSGKLEFDFSGTVDSLAARPSHREYPLVERTFTQQNDIYEMRLVLENVTGIKESEQLSLRQFGGYLLIRRH